MKCPLCGCEFTEGATGLCQRCPLHQRTECHLVCCPNCGYQWPQRSRLVDLLQRLIRRRGASVEPASGKSPHPAAPPASLEAQEAAGIRTGTSATGKPEHNALKTFFGRWVVPIFRHRPLGPELAPEVVQAFELERQRAADERQRSIRLPFSEPGLLELQRLCDLRVGTQAWVFSVMPDSESRLHRLNSLGVVPGSYITLHQKKPSFVVKVDETLLAIDRKVASRIYVVITTEDSSAPETSNSGKEVTRDEKLNRKGHHDHQRAGGYG